VLAVADPSITGLSLRIKMIILVGQNDETAQAAKPEDRRLDFF
jgi:hypothetical protein